MKLKVKNKHQTEICIELEIFWGFDKKSSMLTTL